MTALRWPRQRRHSVQTRVRCPHCSRKFILSEAQTRELGYRLDIPVDCCACHQPFPVSLRPGISTPLLDPEPDEGPALELLPPPEEANPSEAPRRGMLPFRPLIPPESAPSVSSLPPPSGFVEKPPFAPMQEQGATANRPSATSSILKSCQAWWNRQSPGRQKLYLGILLVGMAILILGPPGRGSAQRAKQAPVPAEELPPAVALPDVPALEVEPPAAPAADP